VNRDAGVPEIALQRPLDLLTRLNRKAIGGMAVGSSNGVPAEPDYARRSEPAAGDDKGRSLHRGGEPDPVHHPVVQRRYNDIVPVMILHHQDDLTPSLG
jgi:hypothetical protein